MTSTYTDKVSKPLTMTDIIEAQKALDKIPKPEFGEIEVGGQMGINKLKEMTKGTNKLRRAEKEGLELPVIGVLYGMPVKINKLLPENCIKIGDKHFLIK